MAYYTLERTHQMLRESVVLVQHGVSYRIEQVGDLVQDSNGTQRATVLLTDEDSHDSVEMDIRNIDLSNPDTLLYEPIPVNP